SMRARAYTYGRDIVFNQGEFAPESATGRSLLAHELAHVAQQASAARHELAFKKQPAAPTKFYKEVEDAVAATRSNFMRGDNDVFLEQLLALSKAVESQDEKEVKRLSASVVSFSPPGLIPYIRSDEFVNELITRTFLMGLESETNTLRHFFRALSFRPSQRNP